MPLTRTTRRRILLALTLFCAVGAVKLWMAYGPTWPERWSGWKASLGSAAPPQKASGAVFPWHARQVIQAGLGFPRSLEGMLPAPAPGSQAALQLKGMGLWDGGGWTPAARNLGEPEGAGLRVRLGQLRLGPVADVSPSRDYNGPELCQVDCWVTWDLGAEASDLLRVERLIGLRRPRGLSVEQPGAAADQQVTLERAGLGWRVWQADRIAPSTPGRPARGWGWLGLLL